MTPSLQYPISPIPFTAVTFDDTFWRPRQETNRTVTVPYDFQKCAETGRLDNFAKAAGIMDGDHEGIFFNDSDVFKIIEGAAYTLATHPDPELDAYLDKLIAKIAASQEEDGYLYTARTIAERNGTIDQLPPDREGQSRWSNLAVNHELYNVGHMYEAAFVHFRATGKRNFLDVALKNADLIDQVFGPDKLRNVPGHQQIEIGLCRLYDVTGDEKYLQLAKFFLDERGHANGRALHTNFSIPGYMQDHLPVTAQDEAVGHAVRAVYMYSGMADVAALTGDAQYITALDTLWANVVTKKLYLTGGIGARHHGESFGDNYELPNDTAYTETCAAIANAMWNHRMFLLHGDAKYIDVLERTIYNGYLSGIAFSGDRFFYVNPLAFDGNTNFNRDDTHVRNPWFSCSCCPSNVVRFFPALPGYVYAIRNNGRHDELYVNLFVQGRATVDMADTAVDIVQETNYPWDGRIKLTIAPTKPTDFALYVRIPGWARNQPVPGDLYRYLDEVAETPTLHVNTEPVPIEVANGFARIRRTWQAGDVVELDLPMPVRRVISHEQVVDNVRRVALERGPLVYCIEAVDNGDHIADRALADDAALVATYRSDLFDGITTIQGTALNTQTKEMQPLVALPYYAWAHRGVGAMAVWLPRAG